MKYDILRGKRILFLGSSVTYGHCSGGVAFPELLAERYGCVSVKEAVSGTTLVPGDRDYIQRMHLMPTEPADLFVCQLGTNDATKNKPLPDIEAAVREIIRYARATWHCPVMFYTSPRYDSAAYQAMVDMLLRVAAEEGVTVLDLWNDEAFNAVTPEQHALYMADKLHPTLAGYRDWWLPAFAEACATVLSGGMSLRPAVADDTEDVLSLYNSVKGRPGCLWDEDYPNADIVAYDLAHKGLYLLEDSGVLIGAASVITEIELDDLTFWTDTVLPPVEIARIVIHPDHQGQGLAKDMLRMLFARLKGVGAVRLLAGPENPAACKTYSALGFREVGRCFKYGHDYIAMELLP